MTSKSKNQPPALAFDLRSALVPDASDFLQGAVQPFPEPESEISEDTWLRKSVWFKESTLDRLQLLADRLQKKKPGKGNTSKLLRELVDEALRQAKVV